MFGYASLKDCKNTMFGNNWKPFVICGFFGLINSWITKYMWGSTSDVYFLYTMLLLDFITGIYSAYRNRIPITSKKMPRVLINLIGYSILLSVSWNMSLKSIAFKFLPTIIYNGFLGVTFYSIYENLDKSGVQLSKNMITKIKDLFKK